MESLLNYSTLVAAFTPALQRFAQTNADRFEMDIFSGPEGGARGGRLGRIIATRTSTEIVVRLVRGNE